MTPETQARIARLGYITGFGLALATPAFAQVAQLTSGLLGGIYLIIGLGVGVLEHQFLEKNGHLLQVPSDG